MDRIALTGATSMIGVALINECIKKNVRVLAIVRPNSENCLRIPKLPLIEVAECSLEELDSLQETYGRCDVFFHLGWIGTNKANRLDPLIQNKNIQYTLDAVNLAKRLGCYTFVGAGSQAEYGRSAEFISPETPVNPDTAYGIAKYAAGRISGILCRDVGLKFIWTRVFSIYGIYDGEATLVMYCIRELLHSKKPSLSLCQHQWDYLFCEDAGRAFYLLGERGKDHVVYCIGSGQSKPLVEFVEQIRNEIDIRLPLGIGDIPYSPIQVMNLKVDITNLQRDTGFEPATDFAAGIIKTIDYMKNLDKFRME